MRRSRIILRALTQPEEEMEEAREGCALVEQHDEK